MSEPLVIKVDASDLENANAKLDEFADKADKAEQANDSLAQTFAKQADATGKASAGYDQLTVMQRAYLDGNTAIIRAYEGEYDLALRKLQVQAQEADGYAQLSAAQRAQVENNNVLQAQEQAEAAVLAAVARAQDNLAKSTERTTQVVGAQSKTVQDVTAYWERQRQAHNNWVASSKAVDAQLTKQREEFVELSLATQRVLDRYDPLGTKLRALQSDFARLNAEVAGGAGAGNEQAVEKAYAGLNAEMVKVKGMMEVAGAAGEAGMKKVEKSAVAAALGSSLVTRELITMGREAVAGNFTRIPGSFSLMLQGAGKLEAVLSFLLNPLTLIGVAFAGLIALMVKGQSEIDHFNLVLEATNNYAGLTADAFQKMAERVSGSTTLTIGTVKEIANQMIATGKYTADNIEQMMRLVDNFATITGQSTSDAAKYLTKLFEDPTKAAYELNGMFKQLDAAELTQIKNLQDEGREQEAVTAALDAFNSHLPDHINNLGEIERAWLNIKKAVSGTLDAIKNFGSRNSDISVLEGMIASVKNFNSNVFGALGRSGMLGIPTSGMERNLEILKAARDEEEKRSKAAKDVADYSKQQQDALQMVDKYATEATQRTQLLAAKQKIGLLVTDDPEQLSKQLEAIQKIDEALANLGKKKPTQFEQTMEQIRKLGIDAQLAYLNVGKSIEDQAVPAQKMLDQLKGANGLEASPVWKAFSAEQKTQVENELNRIAGLERSTKSMENQQKAQEELTKLQASFAQASTQAQKAIGQANAATQVAAIQKGLADAKKAYDAGLIDFKTFQEAETKAQKDQLEIQLRQQQDNLNEQQKLLADLQDKVMHLTPAQFGGDQTKFIKTYVDLAKQIVAVDAQVQEGQSKVAITTQKLEEVGTDYIEKTLVPMHRAYLDLIPAIQSQIDQQQEANATYGMAASAVQQYKAAQAESLLLLEMENQKRPDVIAFLKNEIAARQQLAGVLKQGEDQRALLDTIKSIDDEARQVWGDVFNGGHDTFKKLGDDIKKYLIDALYQLTVRPFLINIAANLLSVNGGQAASALGLGNSSNPILNLLGLGGNSGSTGPLSFLSPSNLAGSFATSSVGQFLGLSSPVVSQAGSLSLGVETAGAAASDVGLTSAGSALTAVAPYIPLIAAAVPMIVDLFSNHEPSQVHARFNVTPTGTGAATNEGGAGGTVASPYGDLGFNNADTMYFSGSAGTALSNIVLGALQAFQPRLSGEQNQRLTQTLQSTNFGTFEGSYTTEDFIKQYGGDILKKVVVAAFNELDPALAKVADAFTGTADDIAKFANSLLAIHDATQAVNNEDFTKNVETALQGADQAAVDKILSFVTIVQGAGDALDGLSQHMQALDPSEITKFVDALGGAQQALAGMAFINANFTTSTQRAQQAQKNLDHAWQAAGVTMDDLATAGLTSLPQTHEQFLALINSLDLSTQHGRELAADLVNTVAPAFVAVQGSADAAAQAAQQAADKLNQQAQAGLDLYFSKIATPAEQAQHRIEVDQTKIDGIAGFNDVLHDLNREVPQSVAGIRDLYNAAVAKYGADSAEARAVEAAIPALYDMADAAGNLGDAAAQAADAINKAWNQIDEQLGAFATSLGNLGQLAGEAKDFGTQLSDAVVLYGDQVAKIQKKIDDALANPTALNQSQLTYVYMPELQQAKAALDAAKAELDRFNELSAAYGSSAAEQLVKLEERFAVEQKLYAGNASALEILNRNFQTEWDAIIAGAKDGLGGVQQSIEDFIKSIEQISQQTGGNAGQRAALNIALAAPKISSLTTQLAGLDPTSETAKAIAKDLATITAANNNFIRYLADFTTYTAQYGEDVANQLVTLEENYDTWKAAVGDNAAALAVLNDIFNSEWKKIIDGTKNGVDEVQRALQGIADYLKGLQVGNLSPLTPLEQYTAAQNNFLQELTKAQAGDLTALQDITKYSDAFLEEARSFSPASYREIFETVTGQLGTLAGTTSTGSPLDATTAIASALPTAGKLMSSEDAKTLAEQIVAALQSSSSTIIEAIAASADASTADAQTIASATLTSANLTAAVGGTGR